jgi:exopolyphosphatase / guanosine-5'-triphosphate,3'-diphosphate pyrophosphatase
VTDLPEKEQLVTPEQPVNATPVAVVDIGTTSIRMAIAEIFTDGRVNPLETLAQAVNLGKDTFTQGEIEKSTIEDCVRILKSYRQILSEYRIEGTDKIRVVATSAVREASNRLAFLDRIYSATGLQVEPLDEAEVNRITYLSIQPLLNREQSISSLPVVIVEVGGGSTEVLVVNRADVLYAHTYRLGSLRLQEMLGQYRAPLSDLRHIMESQIERTFQELASHVPDGQVQMIALGGDIRFAARQLLPKSNHESLALLPVKYLEEFTDEMLSHTADELVQKYHLTYPDAETLGPALLADLQFAQYLKLDHILVSNVNLRDGLLQEFAGHGLWTDDFNKQITQSALALGRNFRFDEQHALHVAKLCRSLFHELQDEHALLPRYEHILLVAAILHEIGSFIGNAGYHKHSMYIIRNSELFGLGKSDLLLVALVARYHRRASPKPNHEGYSSLDREQRIAVSKMAAILRVADAMDESHSGRVDEIHCSREKNTLVISISNVDDLSLEQIALQQKGAMFEEIFGMQVLLRSVQN